MKAFRDVSISRKLTLGFLAAGIGPLLIAAALALGSELAGQRARGLRDLNALAELIEVSSRATLEFDDALRARETLGTLAKSPAILAASLYKPDGTLFARYVRPSSESFRFHSLPASGSRFSRDRIELVRPIGSGSELAGYIYVVMDMNVVRAQLPRYTLIVAALLAALVGVSFWISRGFQRVISRPILALAAAAQHVQGSGDYSVRAEKHGDDEMGQVIDAFNQMLAAIEERAMALQKIRENLENEIGERVRAEEEIRLRSAELEIALKEIESFSYSVSHDLRTPLRAIDGFSKLLITQFGADLPADARSHLERVRVNTQHMGRLIDDLLAFSQLGKQPLRTQTVAPGPIVRQCLEMLRSEGMGRDVEFVVGDLPPCEADAGLLTVVWMNLLSNALKYTRRREAARIEVGSRNGGATVYFVRDNGIGFDMAYAGRLFGVFQRLNLPEHYEGTGVGLATVQRIVNRHGGRVWGEGEPDRGATFYFTLTAENPA